MPARDASVGLLRNSAVVLRFATSAATAVSRCVMLRYFCQIPLQLDLSLILLLFSSLPFVPPLQLLDVMQQDPRQEPVDS